MLRSVKCGSENRRIAVQFHNVTFQVNQKTLVSGLNLTIYEGEALLLLGRSGSGKTTTLKLINNLLSPTFGEVWVRGQATTKWNPIALRRRIGYVIQETGLFPHLTVEQNIGLVPFLEGWKPQQIKNRVDELLQLVGLEPQQFAVRYPQELSGGQKQRVGIARALAADPPLLLMDEPFAALDPITRLEMQREFHHLQQRLGKTAIFVTHDIQEALILGSKIGLMHQGELKVLATPRDFLNSKNPEAQAFIQCFSTVISE